MEKGITRMKRKAASKWEWMFTGEKGISYGGMGIVGKGNICV